MDEKFDIVRFLASEKNGMAVFYDNDLEIRLFKFEGMYVKQMIPNFLTMVCVQMMYDEDTLFLKEKGQYLKHGGVGIGMWEYYNDEGKLDHTINTDEHFPITWDKMEEILIKKDISLLTADSISRYYDEEKDEATWSIIIKLPMEKGQLYVFDARTGEIIYKEILDMRKEL